MRDFWFVIDLRLIILLSVAEGLKNINLSFKKTAIQTIA
jgi:hypothetical protein